MVVERLCDLSGTPKDARMCTNIVPNYLADRPDFGPVSKRIASQMLVVDCATPRVELTNSSQNYVGLVRATDQFVSQHSHLLSATALGTLINQPVHHD